LPPRRGSRPRAGHRARPSAADGCG
jgi:hypothetical protein